MHRFSPKLTPSSSAVAATQDELSGTGSNRSHGNGSHRRGGGGVGRKNGAVISSHINGVVGRKSGRSTSPVASSTLVSTSSTSASTLPPKPPQSPTPTIRTSASNIPTKRKHPSTLDGRPALDEDSESIRCICGFSVDDGWSVGCDGCGRWVHGVCFGFEAKDKENLPDHWWCWECDPSLLERIDREKARSLQIARLATAAGDTVGNGRRRSSPGVDRKVRKINIATSASPFLSPSSGISPNFPSNFPDHNSHKRKRTSVAAPSPLTIGSAFPFPPSTGQTSSADDFVDIDESWSHSYIDISHDIIPESEARERLRKQASEWRGISAISPVHDLSSKPGWPYFNTAPVRYPHPVSPSVSSVSLRPLNSSPGSVLPPSYAVHTTHPIPSQSLLAPYPSVITSSSTYLQDPLNAYATLGMPKPRVHLIGPPLDVSLDARGKGGKARFVRSGCQPNAVLRPVLCDGKRESGSASDPDHLHRTSSGEQADPYSAHPPPQGTPDPLSFAIFALRDLKVDEEIVLGWEWDDANVVHLLPALLQDKDIFPPAQLAAYKLQMANILRALGATFTSCACGDRAQGCVMRKMKEFVDEVDDWDSEHELQRERELRKVSSGIERSEEFKHVRGMTDGQGSVNIEMIKPLSTSEIFSDHLSPSHPTNSHHQPPSTTGSFAASSMTPPFDSSSSSTIPGNLQTRTQTSDFSHSSHLDARPLSPSLIQQEQLEQELKLQTQSSAHPTFRRLNKHATAASSQIPSSSAVDLGPLIGVPRGFRTREKAEGSGGLGGVEMDTDDSENRGDSVGVGQDVHTKTYVRPGPQDEKQRNFTAPHTNLNTDSNILSMYADQATQPPAHSFPLHGFSQHPHAYPIHGITSLPPSVYSYGTFYGTPYPFPHTTYPLYIPHPPGNPPCNPRRNGGKEEFFWGDIPSTAGVDKGKGRALDIDIVAVDDEDHDQISVGRNNKEDIDVVVNEVSTRHPQRHRRKQSVYKRHKSPETSHLSDQVVEGPEIPPKMKRRWQHERNESKSPVEGKRTRRAHEDMQVDDDGRTRGGQDPTTGDLSTTTSPAMPIVSTTHAPLVCSPSITSPLLTFANLSLLSPVPISSSSTSSLYPLPDRQLPSHKSTNWWDVSSQGSRHQSKSPMPRAQFRSQSPPRHISPTRRAITDPLAALAAAAAAARPISPLPNRIYSDSRSKLRSRSPRSENRLGTISTLNEPDHDRYSYDMTTPYLGSPRRSRRMSTGDGECSDPDHHHPSHFRGLEDFDHDKQDVRQSRATSMLENHDAVLGPGGIRVLSSPEHEWLPLRKGDTSTPTESSYGVANVLSATESIDHSCLERGVIAIEDELSVDSRSLQVKAELLNEDHIPSSTHVVHKNYEPLEVVDVERPCIVSTSAESETASQITQPSHLVPTLHPPLAFPNELSRSNLLSPTDSYVAPLSPLTPPATNLKDIPPWPASPSLRNSPSVSQSVQKSSLPPTSLVPAAIPLSELQPAQHNEARPLTLVSADSHAPTEWEPSPLTPSHSPMSALSSVGSSSPINAHFTLHAIENKENDCDNECTAQVTRSSPFSSPLSSPMEKLISLPVYSAPIERSSSSSGPVHEDTEVNCPPPNTIHHVPSELPAATVGSFQSQPDPPLHASIHDVPALEHSSSMSPLHSPGTNSPTTPKEVDSEAVETMDVDVMNAHDTNAHDEQERKTQLTIPSINADLSPPLGSVRAEINFEHIDASELSPQTSPALATSSTPTIFAASKVKKMSLKDFAIRKRRQKEEEEREKKEKEQDKGNDAEQKPVDWEDAIIVEDRQKVQESHVEVEVPLESNGEDDAEIPPETDNFLSPPAKYVVSAVLESNLEQRGHNLPKSDVDVIMKASETLNKLMNSSSMSMKSMTVAHDYSASPPHFDVSTAATTPPMVSPLSASPNVTSRPPRGLITDPIIIADSSLSSLTREKTMAPHSVPEDGEIEDGDSRTIFRFSPSPKHPSSNIKSSYLLSASQPKSYSPPPRAFKIHENIVTNEQRSRTPPTQPRSFTARSPSVSSVPHGSPPIRRLAIAPVANGLSPKVAANVTATGSSASFIPSAPPFANPALGRTPPSGPRALRQLQQHQHNSGGAGHTGPRNSNAYIPRGLPYDRDRFRDRGGDFGRERDRDLHWNAPGVQRLRTSENRY
ncbi:Le.MFB1 [Lentinula lateritia]|nr:Le.MFB1 [Lentinula lateritia]